MTRRARTLAIVVVAAGCTPAPQLPPPVAVEQPAGPSEYEWAPPPVPPFVGCERPTDRTCVEDVTPVCAADRDDEREAYASACIACQDPQVVGYWPVPCDRVPAPGSP